MAWRDSTDGVEERCPDGRCYFHTLLGGLDDLQLDLGDTDLAPLAYHGIAVQYAGYKDDMGIPLIRGL